MIPPICNTQISKPRCLRCQPERTTFKKPTFCAKCHQLLLGLFHQGFICPICKSAFHAKCLPKINCQWCGKPTQNIECEACFHKTIAAIAASTNNDSKIVEAHFNPAHAKWLAGLCQVGYKKKVTDECLAEGTKLLTWENMLDGTSYFLAAGVSFLAFVFRGTCNFQNIFTDLQANLVKLSWHGKIGKVHAGFNASYSTVRIQLFRQLASIPIFSRKLFITGHSLGGALATLFAADLALHLPNLARRMTIYTFGSPRVGDETFADFFNKVVTNSFRCGNASDLITKLPLWSLLFKYKHVKKLVPLENNNSKSKAKEVSTWPAAGVGEIVTKLLSHNHLQQWDVRHHVQYFGAQFPKNPFQFLAHKDEDYRTAQQSVTELNVSRNINVAREVKYDKVSVEEVKSDL